MQMDLNSVIANHLWPAILDQNGSQMLAILYQLEKSQYLKPKVLQQQQFRQLNQVWRHAFSTVPFYHENFQNAGFSKNSEIIPEQWSSVPILTRRMLQQKEKELLSKKAPESHGNKNVISTSGSTGLPIRVVGTQLTALFWKVLTLRDHIWHQRDFSGKLAAIRHVEKGVADYPGKKSSGWGPATSPLVKTGPAILLSSSMDINLQAKWLLEEEPEYLLTYPSNLKALAEFFLENNLRLNRLKEVRALGETLGSNVRSLCRKVWDVQLVDMYTAQEVGYIALQCPKNENIYHIQAESLFVEVIDDEGNACKPGETGRVLVTSLHNFAMPLIRYEIGDYAETGRLCSCGRTLPVLNRIMGRRRNMLLLPDGKKSWPSFGMSMWVDTLPVKQFQFVQKSLDRIEARLVTGRRFSKEEERHFANILQKNLGHPFKINIVYLDTISRSKGGKFEDFLSEIS